VRIDVRPAAQNWQGVVRPGSGDAADFLFRRMPGEVVASLTSVQVHAIRNAFTNSDHAVDLRPTFNLLGLRLYMVFQLGRERRSPTRLANERTTRRFWTLGNVTAMAAFFGLLGLSAVGAALMAARALGIR
jgi:hypothetical protein